MRSSDQVEATRTWVVVEYVRADEEDKEDDKKGAERHDEGSAQTSAKRQRTA